jgi:hypothetical protein
MFTDNPAHFLMLITSCQSLAPRTQVVQGLWKRNRKSINIYIRIDFSIISEQLRFSIATTDTISFINSGIRTGLRTKP